MEAPYIAKLWLINVPEGTIIFMRLTLLAVLFDTLSSTITIAILANGDIKKFQIVISSINFAIFPATYFTYRLGFAAYSCYTWTIIATIVKLFFELPLLRDMVGLKISKYMSDVIFRIIPSMLLMPIIPFLFWYFLPSNFIRLLIVVFTTLFVGSIIVYIFSTTNEERNWVKYRVKKWKQNISLNKTSS